MRVVWQTGRRITNEILGVKGLTLIKWSDRMGVIRDDRSARTIWKPLALVRHSKQFEVLCSEFYKLNAKYNV